MWLWSPLRHCKCQLHVLIPLMKTSGKLVQTLVQSDGARCQTVYALLLFAITPTNITLCPLCFTLARAEPIIMAKLWIMLPVSSSLPGAAGQLILGLKNRREWMKVSVEARLTAYYVKALRRSWGEAKRSSFILHVCPKIISEPLTPQAEK